ncbi:hypothetical protein [Fictibacillus gelatini]|uniref:hypothetical protein n=1 Tax=Fictibacillus gelatini TaxID=225985 RepID=UPI000410B7C8|nr:hypothetical protein [Fictibacillus gelatini]
MSKGHVLIALILIAFWIGEMFFYEMTHLIGAILGVVLFVLIGIYHHEDGKGKFSKPFKQNKDDEGRF